MSCPINKERLDEFKLFIDICKKKPDILHAPELAFFKTYIESLGGKVPPRTMSTGEKPTPKETEEPKVEDVESEPESDLELDMEGCIEPDPIDPNQKMGDPNKEVSEEDADKADEKRSEAMREFSEGNFEKAIQLFTEGIEINPKATALFVKRGQSYLKLNKPNACIKDCTRALELNPDSAPAYKFRGRAYRLLGDWEKSSKDLIQACNIDFDEQTDEWLKEVRPNAKKIEAHRIKQERKRLEREERERRERIRKAREAHAAASEGSQPQADEGGIPGGRGSNFADFYKLLEDPEIMEAFKDPEVAKAFQDISTNPASYLKYQSNPKIATLISKLSGKLASSGGNVPGFPGFGFPGADFEEVGSHAPNKPPEDDNLD